MTTPTRPKRFEKGQRWRWTRDDIGRGAKAGDLFVVAKVDDAGDAFDEFICCSRARITGGGHPWSNSLEYLGMASGEGEGLRMGERGNGWPLACLLCGGALGSFIYVCRSCCVGFGQLTSDGYAAISAWDGGARDFPRKPKATLAVHPSTVAPPGSSATGLPLCSTCGRLKSQHTNPLAHAFGEPFPAPLRPAPNPVRIEVASDPAGRTRIDYRLLLDPEPVERYRWIWRDGKVDPACAGVVDDAKHWELQRHIDRDVRMAATMASEGRTTLNPWPAPAPYVCAVTDADLLPDADEPICPPRARGLRKPGALR